MKASEPSGPPFSLERDAHGRLVLRLPTGACHVGVVAVRAFPLAAPGSCVALLAADGHELAWIEQLARLPGAARSLIEEELAAREFVPELKRLVAVSSFSTPSTWEVETDRGTTRFVLKGEEDIRRVAPARLLITSAQGLAFAVPDIARLDRPSRRLLERFL